MRVTLQGFAFILCPRSWPASSKLESRCLSSGQDGAHPCASLLQMWPSVSHGLHLSTYPTYQLFVCGKCSPWSWKTGGLACGRLRVRMRDVGEVDKYHYLQRDMRKGRDAGVGDRGPSLGSSSGWLASLPHTAGQAPCWGPGDMKGIQHGSSAQLHLWAPSRSPLRR